MIKLNIGSLSMTGSCQFDDKPRITCGVCFFILKVEFYEA